MCWVHWKSSHGAHLLFHFCLVIQGSRGVFLSEGTGDEWKAPIGGDSGTLFKVSKYVVA